MTESEDGSSDSETGRAAGYTYTDLPEDGHIRFRKCAACGSSQMKPESSFTGGQMSGGTDRGLNYRCPDCDAEAMIWDSGAFFMGSIYSLFWGAAGIWAFISGPLWYAQHLSYFLDNEALSFLPLDILAILFYLAVMALGGWMVWTFALSPLKTLIQHPVTRENREKTEQETAGDSTSRRSALMSFFVYPLFMWAILLAVFWVLDAVGVEIRDNEFVKYTGIAAILGLITVLGKRYGGSAAYAFVGMVFWLAIIVTVIFTLG